jgi:hypothetical protein
MQIEFAIVAAAVLVSLAMGLAGAVSLLFG